MLDPSGSPPKKMATEAGLSELDKYSTNPGLAAAWRKLVICSTTNVCAVQREAEASEYRQPIQVRREREDVVLLGDELSAALDNARSDTPHLHCPPPSISPPPNQSPIPFHPAMAPLIIGTSCSLALSSFSSSSNFTWFKPNRAHKKKTERRGPLWGCCHPSGALWGCFGRRGFWPCLPHQALSRCFPSWVTEGGVHHSEDPHGWCCLVPYFRFVSSVSRQLSSFPPKASQGKRKEKGREGKVYGQQKPSKEIHATLKCTVVFY
jgi:hypothetical protein